jgi:hypothetical protein
MNRMRSVAKILFVYLLIPSFSFLSAQNVSARIANYTITARLFPKTKTIRATEKICWHNRTQDVVGTLQLHLYMNAFKGSETTFMQERRQSKRFSYGRKRKKWGNIVIAHIQTAKGVDLTACQRFIHPDNDNINDRTVVEVDLPEEVQPWDSLCIEIDFVVTLPEIIARTGCQDNFYMVGQWFPKLGVYEAGKGWNCHQFHANSEFYADFGLYDVTIRLPSEYIVGATGIRVEQQFHPDSTKSVRYWAPDVHDFAWAADPKFEVVTDNWQDVTIRFLTQPGHDKQIKRQLTALKDAFTYCHDWFGAYPYKILTVIDPPEAAFEAGGMEYPMLITAGFTYDIFNIFHFMEEVVVHEFCHQYWYGLVASNEAEEAWLDEGFTTYSEMKILDSYYNGSVNVLKFSLLDRELTWLKYALSDARGDRIYKKSWEYELGNYYICNYAKPALLLLTLENYVGKEIMCKFMQSYFNRFRFRHVKTRDFISTFCQVAGFEWQEFLEEVLYGTGDLDYQLYSVTNRVMNAGDGSKHYACRIVIFREGEISCPVEIESRFTDGSSRFETWNGRGSYHTIEYRNEHPLISAEIDPAGKNWLDSDRLNNSKNAKNDRQIEGALRNLLLFWVQNLLNLITYGI